MKKLSEIPSAAEECCEDDERDSNKCKLALKLDVEGLKPMAVGQSIVTIERCEEHDLVLEEIKNWGTLCLTFYEDPDVTGAEGRVRLYLEGDRYGVGNVHMEFTNVEGKRRVFLLEPKLVRSEF